MPAILINILLLTIVAEKMGLFRSISSYEEPGAKKLLKVSAITLILIGILIGGLLGYSIGILTILNRIDDLQGRISTLENRISSLQLMQNSSGNMPVYVLEGNVSLS